MSKNPIVLYVIDTLATGGAEKSLIDISSRLKKFTPIICVVFSKSFDLEHEFINRKIEVLKLNLTEKGWWRTGPQKLKKIIQERSPALVHATLFKSEIITRLAMRNSPIPNIGSFVNDSYSAERYRTLNMTGRLKLEAVRWIDRLTSRYTGHYVSITNTILVNNTRALNISPDRITVIYRGRDLQGLKKSIDPHRLADLKEKYGNGPVFLTVARLLKRKGYEESIRAFSELAEEFPAAKYLIAGEGQDHALFKKLIEDLGMSHRILLLGNRKDVPELLSIADYFVFPSHYEGQGGALIEAMMFSKPIIASKIPVIEEQVEHGVSARLFTLKDKDDLYSQMKWMLTHHEQALLLGAKANLKAMEFFDIDRISEEHENLYLKLLSRQKNRKL
jgi:glycosyltransferase involved in cell wall biosynthesis